MDYMEFFDAIAKRHSYRGKYKNVAVPREHLRKMISAGLSAPSGCNKQTAYIIGVDDKDMLAKIWVALGRLNENWWKTAARPKQRQPPSLCSHRK